MICQASSNQKKVDVPILISNKIDFKPKIIMRDKDHYVMIKGSVDQEDITTISIYAPNI